MLTIFSQNKGREKTNLDMVKDLMSGSSHSGSRLNYRDESSGPIQSPGAGDTTFGQQWSRSRQQAPEINHLSKYIPPLSPCLFSSQTSRK